MAQKEAIELIVWRDHWGGYEQPVERDEIRPGCVLACAGFVVKETRDEVMLAMEVRADDPTDRRVRTVRGILKKEIISRRGWDVTIPKHRKT